MDNGFILLSRSLLDSEVFASQKMLKIWLWCLLKANYKDNFVPLKVGKGETIVKVKRGQFLFGRFKAEEELFIDGSTIYKIMQKLEQIGNINIESNNQYSVITICNYNTYQSSNNYKVTAKEQPSNNQVTTKEQPSNTTNKVNKVNKVKKVKNIKERESQLKQDLFIYVSEYPEQMLDDFYRYWSEPNKNKTKMKFEMEKTWDLARRLKTWFNNEQKWNKKRGKKNGEYTAEQLKKFAEIKAGYFKDEN